MRYHKEYNDIATLLFHYRFSYYVNQSFSAGTESDANETIKKLQPNIMVSCETFAITSIKM